MSTKGAHRFVRHADETVVYVNSRRAGERVMAGTTQFVESKIKLRVNGDKSTVAGHGNRIFCWVRLLLPGWR